MKARHHLEVVRILATAKDVFDAFFQFGGNLIQRFILVPGGSFLFSQTDPGIIMRVLFQYTMGAERINRIPVETRNDDVIHHGNPQHFTGFFERFGRCQVFIAGGQFSGRMVVTDQHGYRFVEDRVAKDFPGVNDGTVDCPDRDLLIVDDPILGVEKSYHQ